MTVTLDPTRDLPALVATVSERHPTQRRDGRGVGSGPISGIFWISVTTGQALFEIRTYLHLLLT